MFRSRPRKGPYRVTILGFSDVERAALGELLRLAERRVPAYLQVGSDEDSDFLIAEADHPGVLARVDRERRTAETVFIGAQAPDEALAWLGRPIESPQLLRALDTLLGRRAAGDADTPGAAAPGAETNDQGDSTSPAPAVDAAVASSVGGGRKVLVAHAGAIERAVLIQQLVGLGYRVSVATSGEEALESADWTAFRIVFIDLGLGRGGSGLDGLQLCQQLKRSGIGAPAVVITTGGQGGAIDQVRAALAGCDLYATRPLRDTGLHEALRQVDSAYLGAAPRIDEAG